MRLAGVSPPKEWRTFWGKPGYQVINSTWRDPATGQLFEMQFHTPASFDAMMVTHPIYQVIRLPGQDPAIVADLRAQQDAVFATVPYPPGAERFVRPGG